jgi:hypothetical protein
LGFLGAAGVLIAFRPSAQRWRSSWVVLLPVALFGAFLIFYQRTADGAPDPGFSDLLAFASESWTMLTAAVSGLSGVLEAPVYDRSLAQFASLALLAVVVVGASVRRRQLRPTFWAAVAGLVILVVATRMSPGGFIRSPDAPRYLYPETILFLWILVELAGAWHDAGTSRTRTVVAGLATGVLVLGLWSNVAKLQDAGEAARTNSAIFQGQFSAYELERARLMPSYAPNPFFPTAGDYLAAAGAYGSIGLPPRELGQASQLVRASADRAMVGSLGLGLSAARPGRATPPCKSVRRLAELELPAGGALIGGGGLADATFTLGRFADVPVARLPPAPVTETAALRIPRDGARIPWRLRVASLKPVSVCALPGS